MMDDRRSSATSIDSFLREVAQMPAVSLHDPVGETVGRYRVVRMIGKGGMGRVYEAEDLELGRIVAVKFLPASLAQRADRVARFVRERAITAVLEHPAIIPVYDAGVWSSGEPYFVMRRVHGEPLDRRLAACSSVGERVLLLGHVVAAADAVAFAHSRGVVHRDLKPANLLVGSFGEVFVADWGLAKRLREPDVAHSGADLARVQGDGHETYAGAVLGTPAYMAPEQREGGACDERSDVYALGAILHEVLAGATPDGRARLEGLPPSLGDLAAVTAKCLAADPADRYASASELATELHRFQAGQLVGARRYTRTELVARWIERHRAGVLAGAAMTLVVLVVALVSLLRVIQERDVASRERASADSAGRRLEERNQALVLSQARAELTRDPTASLAWLKRYPLAAGDWSRAERVAADAVARGVAQRVWQLGAPIGSVAFSPDGRTLAVGRDDGLLALIDVAGGAARMLRAPDGVGARVVWAPDGALAVTSDGVDVVRLWDVAAGTSRRLSGEHVGGHHIAFSADGSLLVVRHPGGFDATWRLPSGEPASLSHGDALVTFAARPGAVVLARGDALDEIDLATDRLLATTRIDGPPYDLQSSGDGQWIAASRYDALFLWNPGTGVLRRIQVGKVVARVVAPSAAGHVFVTCGLATEAWLFDADRGTARLLSTGERCTREGFSFSPDGSLFVSTGLGAELRLHRGDSVRQLLGHEDAVSDAAFSPDGRWLASASSDGSARIWSVDRGEVRILGHARPFGDIAATGRLLVGEEDGSMSVVDVVSGDRERLMGPRPESARWGALAGRGLVAVMPDASGTLVAWDLARHASRPLGRGAAQDARNPGVQNVLSADGSLLVQADEQGGIRLVDTSSGSSRTLDRLDDKAFGLALSGDRRLLAASTRAGELRTWDLPTGATRSLLRVQAILWDVGISRDDAHVAVAANDGLVYVVAAATGSVTRLAGHVGAVVAVDFLPDGRLLSAGADGTVRLWDLARGNGVIVRREAGLVWSLGCSGEGSLVASGSGSGVTIWKAAGLPPPAADVPAFAAWALGRTTAEVDESTGHLRSAPLPSL